MARTPKRAEERTGHPSKAGGFEEADKFGPEDFENLPFDVELLVEPPEGDTEWHPAAKRLYESLKRDPARIWMGPTAWAISWLMCESMSRELYPQAIGVVEGGIDPDTGERVPGHVAREIVPMKGQTINALLAWAKANGVHESDRLALRKEVTFNNPALVDQGDATTDADIIPIRPGYFQTPKEA